MIEIFLPIHTVSESNSREFWAKRAKRIAGHRRAALLGVKFHVLGGFKRFPDKSYRVELTRCSPRMLDDDNLRGALKGARDGVADAFEVNDRDPRIEWAYGQVKSKEKGVRVRIEEKGN